MDGSTAYLIAIPIVVSLSLGVWLRGGLPAAHPQWERGPAAVGADHPSQATPRSVPPSRARSAPALADAGQDATPGKPSKLAA